MRYTFTAIAALSLLAGTGCSAVDVEINAYRSELPFPGPDAHVYVEAIALEEPALLSRELRQLVVRELESRGYKCVDNPDEAGVVISCTAGIDSGHTVVENVPRSEVYYGTTHTYGRHGFVGIGYSWGTGTTYVPESYREFDRRLMVTMADAKLLGNLPDEKDETAIIWEANAVSTGASRDLRRILRYLLAAVFDHFGRNTLQAVHHSYSEDDDSVRRFE